MRTLLALFVVIFSVAAIGVWFVMATELRVIASILLVGFAIVTAGIGAVLDYLMRPDRSGSF